MTKGKCGVLVTVLLLLVIACGPAATATVAPATPTAVGQVRPTPVVLPEIGLKPTVVPRATATPAPSPGATSGAGPKYGGVLRVALGIVPEGWDPFRHVRSFPEFANYIHGRLFSYNDRPPGCRLTPWGPGVAEAWRWTDDTTIEVKLRPGIRFQNVAPFNGRELSADDLVYSITKQWPRIGVLQAVTRPYFQNATAVDKQRVRIKLNAPYAAFPERLFVEKRAFVVGPEMYGGREEISLPQENVGLGAFVYKQWMPGVRFDVVRNQDYWLKGEPYLDGVTIFVIPDLSSQVAAIRSGKLDLLYIRSVAFSAQLEQTAPQLEKKLCPFPAAVVGYMRTDKAPFNDVRVRRALNMAIDREAMLETVYQGQSSTVYTTVSRFFPDLFMEKTDYPQELRRYLEYNPADAKKLLAEAGYADGFDLTVMAESPVYATLHYGAEFLTSSFAAIGVRAKMQVLPVTEYANKIYQKADFEQMAVGWGTPGATIDESTYDNFHTSSPSNRGRIKDPTLDKIVDELHATTDPEKQKGLVRQHQMRQVEMMWHLVLPQDTFNAFWWPNVRNVNFHGNSMSQSDWVRHIWME